MIKFTFNINYNYYYFQYNNEVYNENRELKVTLNRYQSLQLLNTEYADITGTLIISNKPVMVLSGMVQTNIGGNGYVDHLVDEMPPVNTWSTAFISGDITPNYFYRIKVLANNDNTEVFLGGTIISNLRFAGDFDTFELRGFASITSNYPILVAAFSEGQSDSTLGSPSMNILVPVKQYRNEYTFRAVGDLTNTLTIIAEPNSQLMIDGTPLSITHTSIFASSFVGYTISINTGVHQISSAKPFTATIYANGREKCTISYKIGQCYHDLLGIISSTEIPTSSTTSTTTTPKTTTTIITSTTTTPTTTTTDKTTTTTMDTTTMDTTTTKYSNTNG